MQRAWCGLTVYVFLMIAGCGGSAPPQAAGNPNPGSPAQADNWSETTEAQATNVYLVVLENSGYADVVDNPSMPFWNSLASQYALATNYFANTHPSIGNYFMITTGQTITNDDSFTGTVTVDNLARLLPIAGKTWRVYAESIPQAGYLGPDVYPYVKHHNPFAYFSDVVSSSSQANNIRSFSDWSADIAGASTANVNFVVPNNLHNGHDCPAFPPCSINDKLAAVDDWLSTNLTPLLASSAFQQHGLLIVAFDESQASDLAHGGGHIPVLFVGNSIKRGLRSTTLYQHQSLCRLILDLTDVNATLGAAASAQSMREFFN